MDTHRRQRTRVEFPLSDLIFVVILLTVMGVALARENDQARQVECRMDGYTAARLDSIEQPGYDDAISCWHNGTC